MKWFLVILFLWMAIIHLAIGQNAADIEGLIEKQWIITKTHEATDKALWDFNEMIVLKHITSHKEAK